MNKTIVYLIRHSEYLDIDGIKNISEDEQINNEKIVLSIEGEEKAKRLSELNEFSDIDVLWSSNYVRAISRAKYIANINNIPLNIDSRFNERKIGELTKLKELGKEKEYTFTEEQLIDEKSKNLGGENRFEVNKRMNDALNEILLKNVGKKIAIVSHGAAIKYLLMNWCKLNDKRQVVYDNRVVIDLKKPSAIKLEFNGNELEYLSVVL